MDCVCCFSIFLWFSYVFVCRQRQVIIGSLESLEVGPAATITISQEILLRCARHLKEVSTELFWQMLCPLEISPCSLSVTRQQDGWRASLTWLSTLKNTVFSCHVSVEHFAFKLSSSMFGCPQGTLFFVSLHYNYVLCKKSGTKVALIVCSSVQIFDCKFFSQRIFTCYQRASYFVCVLPMLSRCMGDQDNCDSSFFSSFFRINFANMHLFTSKVHL